MFDCIQIKEMFVLKTMVVEAVRDVERHVMLWDDAHARQIDDQSSVQQIVVRRLAYRPDRHSL